MSKIDIVVDQNKKNLKEAYNQAFSDLELIQTTDLNNNNKLQQAVKAEAAIMEKLLKFLKNNI